MTWPSPGEDQLRKYRENYALLQTRHKMLRQYLCAKTWLWTSFLRTQMQWPKSKMTSTKWVKCHLTNCRECLSPGTSPFCKSMSTKFNTSATKQTNRKHFRVTRPFGMSLVIAGLSLSVVFKTGSSKSAQACSTSSTPPLSLRRTQYSG